MSSRIKKDSTLNIIYSSSDTSFTLWWNLCLSYYKLCLCLSYYKLCLCLSYYKYTKLKCNIHYVTQKTFLGCSRTSGVSSSVELLSTVDACSQSSVFLSSTWMTRNSNCTSSKSTRLLQDVSDPLLTRRVRSRLTMQLSWVSFTLKREERESKGRNRARKEKEQGKRKRKERKRGDRKEKE